MKSSYKKINFKNVNSKIYKSSHRLYLYSLSGLVLGKILQLIKLRSEVQMGNIYASYYQYQALKKGLWQYLIVYAEK